jgi:uncharacterized protein (TIGR03435 family)
LLWENLKVIPARKFAFVSIVYLALITLFASAQALTAAKASTIQSSSEPPALQPAPSESKPVTSFEVASVRLSPPNSYLTSINNSGSPRFIAHNVTLELLVGLAFGVSSGNITGGPNWFDESQRYDVNAKAEGDAPLTPKQFQPLLQQLLKDRFQLEVHRETVYRTGYDLVAAKNGPRLQPAKTPTHMGYLLKDEIKFESASMETLAGVLTSVLGSPVADKTGIKGEYSLNLKYAPGDSTDSSLPSIFTALEEEFGLKLVRDKKVPVETLAIDRVERIPTEN